MALFGKAKEYEFETVTTKGGDSGQTSLYDGSRLSKSDIHFRALGEADLVTSYLGTIRTMLPPTALPTAGVASTQLKDAQEVLYRLMSLIATPSGELYSTLSPVTTADIVRLEQAQKQLLAVTRIPQRFVLPTGFIDVARAYTRLFESTLVAYIETKANTVQRSQDLAIGQKYVNRLSDFLFILARAVDAHH